MKKTNMTSGEISLDKPSPHNDDAIFAKLREYLLTYGLQIKCVKISGAVIRIVTEPRTQ